MDSNHKARVLSIEDEETVRRSLVTYLEDSGYEVLEAENGRKGLELIESESPDIILCDIRMPEMDGLQLLEALRDRTAELPFIVISGTGTMGDAIRALKLGAWDYITKPITDLAVVEHSVEQALERARLLSENRRYRESLEAANERLQRSLDQMEADEEAARRIQFKLLPPPELDHRGYHFSRYINTTDFLSGDFVDYFVVDDKHICFYIADVSGHGVSSAFVTALLNGIVGHLLAEYRRGASSTITDPAAVLDTVGFELRQQDLGKYLTMFFGAINTEKNTLSYCNGGHFPYPLLCRPNGRDYLEQKHLPVGLVPGAQYENITIDLPPAFLLALFSDGVLEVLPQEQVQEKEAYVRERVCRPDMCMTEIVEALDLAKSDQPLDDITVLMLRRGA